LVSNGCCVCWKNEDEARIIICDECDEEFHTYCLQPPLEDVPEGGGGSSCRIAALSQSSQQRHLWRGEYCSSLFLCLFIGAAWVSSHLLTFTSYIPDGVYCHLLGTSTCRIPHMHQPMKPASVDSASSHFNSPTKC
jgi:hypothetical protein